MKKNVDLINGPIDSTLRRFTAPLALSFLIHMLYAWVDMYYVSKIDDYAIAALGLSERIWFFIFAVGSGFAIGSGIIVARRIGEGNKDKANNTSTQSIVMMLAIGIALAIVLYLTIPSILQMLGITGAVRSYAQDYLNMIVFGIPANFIVFQINAIVRSSGNTMLPMMILIFSNVVNTILTPLLLFGVGPFPEMGMQGAGLGTVIALYMAGALAIYILMKGYTPITLSLRRLKPEFDLMLRILKLGIPASLQLIIVSTNAIVIMAVANQIDTTILTTYMLGLRVDLIVYMSIFATGASIEIISGQNLGAGKPERIFMYYKSAVKQLSITMAVLGIVVFFFGSNIAYIFTNDQKIISEFGTYLKFTAFTYIPFTIGILAIRVISGAGSYIKSLMIVGLDLYIIQIPLILLLTMVYSYEQNGIWIGILVSHILFAFIAAGVLYRKKWINTEV